MESIIVSSSLTSYVPSPSSIPLRTNTSICQLQNSTSSFTISKKQQQQKKKTQLFLRPQNRRREVTGRRFSIACGVTEINETQFSETVLKSDRPVLVEFVANWCGPCRLISPAIEWVAQEYKDKLTVVKIDHDANPRLIEQYKVYGLPALILFKSGKEIPESRREGAITKVKLKEYLDALLESMSVT